MEINLKEQLMTKLFEKLEHIGKIQNPIKQMTEYLKLQDYLEEVWKMGYNEGLKEGKKKMFNCN